MTFDYGATMKNLTLTFWAKNFFEVNIHVEILKLILGRYSEDEICSRFVFELVLRPKKVTLVS